MKTERKEVGRPTFFQRLQFNSELFVLQWLYPSENTCSRVLAGDSCGDLYVGRLPLIKLTAQGEVNEGAIIYQQTQQKPLRLVVQALEDHELDAATLLQNRRQLLANDWRLIDDAITVRQVPFADKTANIEFQVMREIIETIKEIIDSNYTVLIHCKAGHGRSVMIALCYLVAYQNMSLVYAVDLIRSIRPKVAIDSKRMCYVAEFITIHYPEYTSKVEAAFPELYNEIWESVQGDGYDKAVALLEEYCEFSIWHPNRHHSEDVRLALQQCNSFPELVTSLERLQKNSNGELAQRLAFMRKKSSQSLEMQERSFSSPSYESSLGLTKT